METLTHMAQETYINAQDEKDNNSAGGLMNDNFSMLISNKKDASRNVKLYLNINSASKRYL